MWAKNRLEKHRGGIDMEHKELAEELKRMSVNTGGLMCMGCGYEHNCSIHGCAILKRAVEVITELFEKIEQLGVAEEKGIKNE